MDNLSRASAEVQLSLQRSPMPGCGRHLQVVVIMSKPSAVQSSEQTSLTDVSMEEAGARCVACTAATCTQHFSCFFCALGDAWKS